MLAFPITEGFGLSSSDSKAVQRPTHVTRAEALTTFLPLLRMDLSVHLLIVKPSDVRSFDDFPS